MDHPAKKNKLIIFMLQMGAPDSLGDVERFIRDVLDDLLPLPGIIRSWMAARIAKKRAPESRKNYAAIGGSPLLAHSRAQGDALKAEMAKRGWSAETYLTMRYSIPRAIDALYKARIYGEETTLVTIPLYPHYCYATTGSSEKDLLEAMSDKEKAKVLRIESYPTNPLYLDSISTVIEQAIKLVKAPAEQTRILFTAHGIPLKEVKKGDPYPGQIKESMAGIMERLTDAPDHLLSFQSRVGPIKWLEPTTESTVKNLGSEGVKALIVVPISFVSEHVETLHELDIEIAEVAKLAGVDEYIRIPAPGTDPRFISALADEVEQAIANGLPS